MGGASKWSSETSLLASKKTRFTSSGVVWVGQKTRFNPVRLDFRLLQMHESELGEVVKHLWVLKPRF